MSNSNTQKTRNFVRALLKEFLCWCLLPVAAGLFVGLCWVAGFVLVFFGVPVPNGPGAERFGPELAVGLSVVCLLGLVVIALVVAFSIYRWVRDTWRVS